MRCLLHLLAFIVTVVAGGCGLPWDPRGTLERVEGGELRAGVTEAPPWTRRNGAQAKGLEAELVRSFAESLDARVAWTWDGEQALFEKLERGELDLVIGGLSDKTPWKAKIGLTKPYGIERRVVLHDGEAQTFEHRAVIAVPPGENGLLRSLEVFLRSRRAEIAAQLEQNE